MRSGKMLLMVTLAGATSLDNPLTTEMSPVRAADDRPIGDSGLFTIAEVMFTMRPKRRDTMPSSTSRMRNSGASMLLSTALCHASRSQS